MKMLSIILILFWVTFSSAHEKNCAAVMVTRQDFEIAESFLTDLENTNDDSLFAKKIAHLTIQHSTAKATQMLVGEKMN
jgi:hypothetical protein